MHLLGDTVNIVKDVCVYSNDLDEWLYHSTHENLKSAESMAKYLRTIYGFHVDINWRDSDKHKLPVFARGQKVKAIKVDLIEGVLKYGNLY